VIRVQGMIDNILKMIQMLPIRINAATTHALMGVERAVSAPLILRNMLGLKVRLPLFPLNSVITGIPLTVTIGYRLFCAFMVRNVANIQILGGGGWVSFTELTFLVEGVVKILVGCGEQS
jgi:hypothetical protein